MHICIYIDHAYMHMCVRTYVQLPYIFMVLFISCSSLYLPELFSRHTAHDTSFDEEEYVRDMDQFTAGLWSEASAGRPLMQYFMR